MPSDQWEDLWLTGHPQQPQTPLDVLLWCVTTPVLFYLFRLTHTHRCTNPHTLYTLSRLTRWFQVCAQNTEVHFNACCQRETLPPTHPPLSLSPSLSLSMCVSVCLSLSMCVSVCLAHSLTPFFLLRIQFKIGV